MLIAGHCIALVKKVYTKPEEALIYLYNGRMHGRDDV